jgi:hypothetical protein
LSKSNNETLTNQPKDTLAEVAKELAAIAGVSHDTVAKVKKIEAKADDLLAEIAEQVEKDADAKRSEATKSQRAGDDKKLSRPQPEPLETSVKHHGAERTVKRSETDGEIIFPVYNWERRGQKGP